MDIVCVNWKTKNSLSNMCSCILSLKTLYLRNSVTEENHLLLLYHYFFKSFKTFYETILVLVWLDEIWSWHLECEQCWKSHSLGPLCSLKRYNSTGQWKIGPQSVAYLNMWLTQNTGSSSLLESTYIQDQSIP